MLNGARLALTPACRPGEQRRAQPAAAFRRRACTVTCGLGSKQNRKADDALPSSLLYPTKGELPPDGRTQKVEDELCDVQVMRCKTSVHTWEQKCPACAGSGSYSNLTVHGAKGRHKVVGTCLLCSGLGAIRKSSARVAPEMDDEHFTVARSAEDPAARAKFLEKLKASKAAVQESK